MRTARRPCRHRAGFTLVEVMVALVVMSVLAVMAWQGVDSIVRSRDISTVKLEQTLRLGTVMTQWDQDLLAIQDSGVVQPAFAFDGGTVRLVRRADRGLQVVVWALRPGLAGALPGKTLQRWVGPPVTTLGELREQWFRSQQLQGVEPEQVRAAQGVEDWQVYCFYSTQWSNCQSSGDVQAPATQATGATGVANKIILPAGVRLVMTFADGSGHSGKLTRDTPLAPRWTN